MNVKSTDPPPPPQSFPPNNPLVLHPTGDGARKFLANAECACDMVTVLAVQPVALLNGVIDDLGSKPDQRYTRRRDRQNYILKIYDFQ